MRRHENDILSVKIFIEILVFLGIFSMIITQPPSMGMMGPPPSQGALNSQTGPGGNQSQQQMGSNPTGGVSDVTTKTCGTTKESKILKYSIIQGNDTGSNSSGYPGGYININTDNCPEYDWTSQTTPNKAMVFNRNIKLPLQPKISKNKLYVGIKDASGNKNSKPVMGAIGVSINGISIFGNANAESNDAFINEGHTFDKCGGHPQMQGEYHYHEEPYSGCVFSDIAGKHSPLFGIMFDGIPIFGTLGDNGVTPTDLDECGGHIDKTYPFYHYHLPANRAFPYTLACLKGCIFNSQGNRELNSLTTTLEKCSLDSKQYDYSPLFNNVSNFIKQFNVDGAMTSITSSSNVPNNATVNTISILANNTLAISTNTNGGSTLNYLPTKNVNNYLPPEIPKNTDKIKNMTDNITLNKLKSLLANLPMAEQDLMADCISSNNQSNRLMDANCFKNYFSLNIKTPMSKGIGDKLTDNSINSRQGLGCLSKVANTFGNPIDISTQIINNDVNNLVAQQTSLNSATAAFSKVVIEILNSKRRQLLTTTDNIDKIISSTDASGNAEGLIFTADEQKSITSSFKTYANFIFNYNSNYSSKVNSIQGMIGGLDQCKPLKTSNSRILQTPSLVQSGILPTGMNGQQPIGSSIPIGQLQGMSGTTTTSQQPIGVLNTVQVQQFQGQNGTQSLFGSQQIPQIQPNGQQMGINDSTNLVNSLQGPLSNSTIFGSNMGTQNNPQGSSVSLQMIKNQQGGKPKGIDGRPQISISRSISNLKSIIVEKLQSKTSDVRWTNLSSRITVNIDLNSSYKPKPSLGKIIIPRLSNSDLIKNEFDKISKNVSCDKDYLFTCTDGNCVCNDADCPAEIKGSKKITINNNVNTMTNNIISSNINGNTLRYLQNSSNGIQNTTQTQNAQQNLGNNNNLQTLNNMSYQQNDSIISYYLGSFCLSGQRYYYVEAELSNSGKSIDLGNDQGTGLGKEIAKEQNNCSNLLANGSTTDKENCRGQMIDDCSKKLDDVCKSLGLYDNLIKNPVSTDPLPVECNDSLTTYSDLACFQWLIPKMSRGTLVFDFKLFLDLPNQIAISNGAKSNSKRFLVSNTYIKVGVDPSLSDSVAIMSPDVYKLQDSDLKVDSATATIIPSTNNYIQNFTTTVQNITLNSNYFRISCLILTLLFIINF